MSAPGIPRPCSFKWLLVVSLVLDREKSHRETNLKSPTTANRPQAQTKTNTPKRLELAHKAKPSKLDGNHLIWCPMPHSEVNDGRLVCTEPVPTCSHSSPPWPTPWPGSVSRHFGNPSVAEAFSGVLSSTLFTSDCIFTMLRSRCSSTVTCTRPRRGPRDARAAFAPLCARRCRARCDQQKASRVKKKDV